jgi:hypothetical protein
VLQDADVCFPLAYQPVEGGLGGIIGSPFLLPRIQVGLDLMLCWIQGEGAFGSIVKARNQIDVAIAWTVACSWARAPRHTPKSYYSSFIHYPVSIIEFQETALDFPSA